MSRKDYELIAAVFDERAEQYRKHYKNPAHHVALAALLDTARHLANELHTDNPRFDREKFLAACGFGS